MSGYSQITGRLFYQKTTNDKMTAQPRIDNYIVFFENNRSVELFQPPVVTENTVATGDNSYEITKSYAGGRKKYFNFKDFEKKRMSLGANILFKYYLIEDSLANFHWIITNEKKTILKYNCTKATTMYRGRFFEAWFTEDVPLQNGPWKFCGLPGLIIKVNDSENIYNFELTALDFKTGFDTKIINIPQAYRDDSALQHHDFLELYNKKIKELEMQSRASVFVNANGGGSSKTSIPPLIEKF